MATLTIPDNVPVAELKQALAAIGKGLQYRPEPERKSTPEDQPHGVHPCATDSQPVVRLADYNHHR